MPLSSASPSFGRGVIGSRPDFGERGRGRHAIAAHAASPTPIIAAAIWASGARSPDAPTDPCDGTTGDDAARKHGFDQRQRRGSHARRALREAAELQRHHQPRCRDGGRFTDARGMRQHDVALKLRKICGRDAHARQFAEAGVDPVDRLTPRQNALDRGGAGNHAARHEGSTASGSPRQIARQSVSDAAPGRITTVIVPSRPAHAAG